MFYIAIILLLSSVNGQNYYQQRQNSYNNNNFNQRQSYPSWNQGIQQNRASVRGNLLSDDISPLPYGSQISVSLTDVSLQDVASRPLNTLVLYGSYRFPIPFEIPYSMAQVQANGNNIRQYTIQVRIEKDGQLLFINDQYTPVQLIPVPTNPINIVLKRIGTGGMYTTRSPIGNGLYICQQNPDVGPCKASIEQYYFNTQLRSCQMFIWGGCGGNQNRFSSRDECERTCSSYRRRIIVNNSKQRSIN